VTILSKKIKSAEDIYTSKRREMENVHLKQLDSIAKKYCDLQQTYKTDLQRCQQEFQARFQEELQTRSQELETVLVQRWTLRENKTSNLFKIEHVRRVKAECLLESQRKKVWQFVSVSSTEEKDAPCID
jgi:dTDP-4-amino-4,6-dideoxygalactose transaminase